MLHVSQHPLIKHKLTILRDVKTDHRQFRELVREITLLLCYEATLDVSLIPRDVQTPLGTAHGYEAKETIGLVPIMRAGMGMMEGVLELLPSVQVWHIGVYRDEKTLKPISYYNRLPTTPSVEICFVLDPMLATGGSATAAIDILREWGVKRVKFIGLLGAPEGVAAVQKAHPDVPIHLAALDDHLNEIGFIVPGLGDAGDRMFGT